MHEKPKEELSACQVPRDRVMRILYHAVVDLMQRMKQAEKTINKLQRQGAKTMATVQEIKDELVKVKQTIVEEKAEVHTEFQELQAEIQALKDQIAGGAVVTQADLDELMVSVKELDASVEDISVPTVPA